MKMDYTNFLTKLAGIVGVTGVSLCMGLPSKANELLNPSPGIFAEPTYNRTPRVLSNTQYVPTEPVAETSTTKKKDKKDVAQKPKPGLNPNPKILQECPYNRAACPGGSGSGTPAPSSGTTEPAPSTPDATPPTTTPDATPPTSAPDVTPTPTPQSGTQSDTVVASLNDPKNGSFKTLTKALEAAGLTETLKGSGPFTIFAPTDKAFSELPQDAVADLLKPANKAVLDKILKYHVVSGQVLSTDLKSGDVKSVEGGAITVKIDAGKVKINDANVTQADIKSKNGVVHVIDRLLLPPNL
jgi:uncharacterized surface protein with fasciclin (FAS1) repeats